jgi:hypothetical protein
LKKQSFSRVAESTSHLQFLQRFKRSSQKVEAAQWNPYKRDFLALPFKIGERQKERIRRLARYYPGTDFSRIGL